MLVKLERGFGFQSVLPKPNLNPGIKIGVTRRPLTPASPAKDKRQRQTADKATGGQSPRLRAPSLPQEVSSCCHLHPCGHHSQQAEPSILQPSQTPASSPQMRFFKKSLLMLESTSSTFHIFISKSIPGSQKPHGAPPPPQNHRLHPN